MPGQFARPQTVASSNNEGHRRQLPAMVQISALMPKPSYKVIHNHDCSDLFDKTKEPITPAHVDRMVDEIASGRPDVILINPNSQRTSYPSKVWQTFWDGYEPGDRLFFGSVPADGIAGREHCIGQMAHLARQCDYLHKALCQLPALRGLQPGISIRMNDMHDGALGRFAYVQPLLPRESRSSPQTL